MKSINSWRAGAVIICTSQIFQKSHTENAEKVKSTPYPIGERYFIRKQSNSQLSMMYDTRTRNPRWVIEVLTTNSGDPATADRKKLRFYKDKIIDIEDFRVITGL